MPDRPPQDPGAPWRLPGLGEKLSRITAQFGAEGALGVVAIDASGLAAIEHAQRLVDRFADGAGELGFISSVSAPFCGSCTRARLSSDGQLFTCLFASEGTDLKGPMRDGASDDELRAIVNRVWTGREDRYSEIRAEQGGGEKVEMYYIGG